MKSSKVHSTFSRLVVFSLVISLLGVQSMIASTTPAKVVGAAEITVSGPRDGVEKPSVVVNGERAFSGRTFFSDGTISTNETSSATVSLGKLGRIELAPSSSLQLSFSEGRIAGSLAKGSAIVSNTDGVSVKIDTPNDSVTNDGNRSSRFIVSVLGDQTSVKVASGTVRYNGGAKVVSKHDDDDDDNEKALWIWGTVAVVAGAIILVVVLNNDNDDVVSPVR